MSQDIPLTDDVTAERERIVDLLEAVDRALDRADDVRRMSTELRIERDALLGRLREICDGEIDRRDRPVSRRSMAAKEKRRAVDDLRIGKKSS